MWSLKGIAAACAALEEAGATNVRYELGCDERFVTFFWDGLPFERGRRIIEDVAQQYFGEAKGKR